MTLSRCHCSLESSLYATTPIAMPTTQYDVVATGSKTRKVGDDAYLVHLLELQKGQAQYAYQVHFNIQ